MSIQYYIYLNKEVVEAILHVTLKESTLCPWQLLFQVQFHFHSYNINIRINGKTTIDRFRVLANEHSQCHLNVLEAVFIKSLSPSSSCVRKEHVNGTSAQQFQAI